MSEEDKKSSSDLLSSLLSQEEHSEEGFSPREVVWIVDEFFTERWGRKVGFIAGVLYVHLTYAGIVGLWAGLTYTLTLDNSYHIRIATIVLAIGTFVLMAGSNLTELFDISNLNFRAYVINAISFIGTGVFFLISFTLTTISDHSPLESGFQDVFETIVLSANAIGALFLVLSIWLLLKVLWRLNQLVAETIDYPGKKIAYHNILSSVIGFTRSFKTHPVISTVTLLIFAIPSIVVYSRTSSVLLAIAVFWVSYLTGLIFPVLVVGYDD